MHLSKCHIVGNHISQLTLFCLGDEMEEKQQLDEQMRAVMDKYKYKRRQIRELQEDLQTMSNTLDNLQRDEDAYVEMVEEKRVSIKMEKGQNFHKVAEYFFGEIKI